MKKMLSVVLLSVGISFGLAISPLPAMATGVINTFLPSVARLNITAPSGAVGIQLKDGAKVNFGTTAYASLALAGTNILDAPGYVRATFGFIGPLAPTAVALGTCAAGTERAINVMSGTGGTGTSLRTRICICTSDGAASPTYAWMNLVSGTVGNATTCSL